MEIPHDFAGFKNKGMKLREQLKQAWRECDLGWLIAFLFSALLGFIVFLSLVINALDISVTSVHKMWIVVFPALKEIPLKTIAYQKTAQTEDKYGEIHSTFELQVHVPYGNPNSNLELGFFVPDSECSVSTPKWITEYGLGTASSTVFFTATCTSEKPIIDKGNLFRAKG